MAITATIIHIHTNSIHHVGLMAVLRKTGFHLHLILKLMALLDRVVPCTVRWRHVFISKLLNRDLMPAPLD
jgi:hypothetical protein